MQAHIELSNQEREMAALNALGCLSSAEEEEYHRHLAECPLCERESRDLQNAAEGLWHWVEPKHPRPELKAELFTALHLNDHGTLQAEGSLATPTVSASTPLVRRSWLAIAQSRAWHPTPIEGVRVKQLFRDKQTDCQVLLVDMKPGTVYPAHRHHGPEEFLVLSGDIQGNGVSLVAGDYSRMGADSEHPDQFTDGGCQLLVRSSLRDRFL